MIKTKSTYYDKIIAAILNPVKKVSALMSLIVVVSINGNLYLGSDGRVTDAITGQPREYNLCKVYQITKYVGMVSAGRHLDEFPAKLKKWCEDNKIIYVPKIIPVVSQIANDIWQKHLEEIKEKSREYPKISETPLIFMIAGFDSLKKEPIIYSFDSRKQFSPELRDPVDSVYALSTNSATGQIDSEKPDEIIKDYIELNVKSKAVTNMDRTIVEAIEKAIEHFSKTNNSIGLPIFLGKITKSNGFEWIKN